MKVRISAPCVGTPLRGSRGVSVVELLLGIIGLCVLAAIAYPVYERHGDATERRQAISELRDLSDAVQHFYGRNMHLPDSLADLGTAERSDPWGFAYRYARRTSAGRDASQAAVRKDRNGLPVNTDFDLFSVGPDGRSAPSLASRPSRDDIIRANNGVFVGVAADY